MIFSAASLNRYTPGWTGNSETFSRRSMGKSYSVTVTRVVRANIRDNAILADAIQFIPGREKYVTPAFFGWHHSKRLKKCSSPRMPAKRVFWREIGQLRQR